VASFAEFVALCCRLESTRGRLEKRRLVAGYLRALASSDVASGVAFLTGRPFPSSDPRVLGVRGLPGIAASPATATPDTGPPLWLADVAAAFAPVAEIVGSAARAARESALAAVATRASGAERAILARIIGGELRTGVSDGLGDEPRGAAGPVRASVPHEGPRGLR
jgi:DNA ligase-1